ncbi:hypothetical protein ARMA_0820 [Ardenticatena maritima]|uniref:Uncharacterized protein n=1 Tax=Ardenticatena maritima TaxID=872965 RepID=A0A0M9UC33_9CHLR|nr:hypothetical protein ARMA_0820 [Ardenticatena maritima]
MQGYLRVPRINTLARTEAARYGKVWQPNVEKKPFGSGKKVQGGSYHIKKTDAHAEKFTP